MYFSLVIPAYNEEKKILRDVKAAVDFLQKQSFNSEILVVNDGSFDNTERVILENTSLLQTEKVQLSVLNYGANRGKGFAVRYGVKHARGKVIAFADSGLCVPFSYLLKGVEKIEKGADFAIATRRHAGAKIKVKQPFHRRIGSKVFWWVVQLFMGVRVSDTQCGFKVYSHQAAKDIFLRLKTDGFMFDIEALIVAKKLDYQVKEFPVEWSNDSDSRYHAIWGTIRNFKELVKIRFWSLYAY